jgi:hypothetical protein
MDPFHLSISELPFDYLFYRHTYLHAYLDTGDGGDGSQGGTGGRAGDVTINLNRERLAPVVYHFPPQPALSQMDRNMQLCRV